MICFSGEMVYWVLEFEEVKGYYKIILIFYCKDIRRVNSCKGLKLFLIGEIYWFIMILN